MLERLDIPTRSVVMHNGRLLEEMVAGEAISILSDMHEELDKGIVDEDAAKGAAINTLAAQSAMAIGGEAGAGKSTMARALARLIGLDYDNSPSVGFVPGSPDLRAQEITGAKITDNKKISLVNENGEIQESKLEVITHDIEGIIDEEIEFLHYEELTAANIRAIRASMSAVGDKTIETAEGRKHLKKLVAVIASMNAAKRQHGTSPLPPQVMDRFPHGAIMGQNHKDFEQRKAHNKAVEKKGKNPELRIEPIVTPQKLIQLGQYMSKIVIDGPAEEKLHNVAIAAADYVRQAHGVQETDHRMVKHLFANAREYGARNRDKVVDDRDIFDATRSAVAARIAPLLSGMEIDLETEISSITNL